MYTDLSHIEEKEIEGKIDITGKNIPKLLDLVPDSKKTDENNIHTDENTKDSKTKHSDEKNHDDFEKESKNIVKLHGESKSRKKIVKLKCKISAKKIRENICIIFLPFRATL